MQPRRAYCHAWSDFWDLWCKSWTDWAQYTYQWQRTANNQELWLCARLLVPLSLINAIPTTERHKLRTEVGLFQFRMIQSVRNLRRKYADPTPQQPPSPLWLTKYVAQALPPRETPQNLRNHVGAPMWCGTKRKRKTDVATEEAIDPDQWLRDAGGTGDDEAVAWFATRADYHRLVTKLVEEQMQAQQLQDSHAHLCQIHRQWYDRAKYDTGLWYADAKLLLLISDRYRRLSAATEKLLDLYQRQATCMWRQQKHLTNMTQCYHDACKHKTTHYWQTTRPARQTIYLIRKRPREHWDPTWWEVPLQPLPKRHKTHWDPNEWEIPMT